MKLGLPNNIVYFIDFKPDILLAPNDVGTNSMASLIAVKQRKYPLHEQKANYVINKEELVYVVFITDYETKRIIDVIVTQKNNKKPAAMYWSTGDINYDINEALKRTTQQISNMLDDGYLSRGDVILDVNLIKRMNDVDTNFVDITSFPHNPKSKRRDFIILADKTNKVLDKVLVNLPGLH